MRRFPRILLVLVLIGQNFFCSGCGCRRSPDGPPESIDALERGRNNVLAWVGDLKAAYISGGIRGFDAAKNSMIANEGVLPDDLDHDTAAMVLGLGETGTIKKEAELTVQLRSLAKYIEAHPRRARAEYEQLRDKLFSYSFGNGPIDYESVPAKLADLYSLIANGNGETAASGTEKQDANRIAQLFGKYVATDYASCSETLHEEREAWASGHLYDEAAILPEVFALRSVVVLQPRYEIRHYPRMVEGEVPVGIRRCLSDFYGAGMDRKVITVLEVYEPGDDHPRCDVEIIDENTLWDTWNGAWLFEWRRDGVEKNPAPLKGRWQGGRSR